MIIVFVFIFAFQTAVLLLFFFLFRKKRNEVKYRVYNLAVCFGNCAFMGVPILEALLPDYPEAVVFFSVHEYTRLVSRLCNNNKRQKVYERKEDLFKPRGAFSACCDPSFCKRCRAVVSARQYDHRSCSYDNASLHDNNGNATCDGIVKGSFRTYIAVRNNLYKTDNFPTSCTFDTSSSSDRSEYEGVVIHNVLLSCCERCAKFCGNALCGTGRRGKPCSSRNEFERSYDSCHGSYLIIMKNCFCGMMNFRRIEKLNFKI